MSSMTEMRAIGYRHSRPIEDPESLVDVTVPRPALGPRDVLVRVEAVSVNPVDTKIRQSAEPDGELRVLGYDAAGTVEAVGGEVSRFAAGDEVFYCGAINRPGANAELHAVDERLVARKPASLSFAQAAALPLTALTAWEALFERLALRPGKPADGPVLLVTASAGGVGSIALQLARRLTGATVIGTASRPETAEWSREMGAHHVVDHRGSLAEEVRRISPRGVDLVLSSGHTEELFEALADVLVPYGEIVVLDEPQDFAFSELKGKSITWHWENVMTRPHEETADMGQHGAILDEVARLVDDGILRTTLNAEPRPIDAANLRAAHAAVEAGGVIGKLVLAGFPPQETPR